MLFKIIIFNLKFASTNVFVPCELNNAAVKAQLVTDIENY